MTHEKHLHLAQRIATALSPENLGQAQSGALLRRGDRVSLIDARLYLPKEWTDDPRRCERADVPRAQQVHRTKLQFAQQIVQHAGETGVRFEWAGVDGRMGNRWNFCSLCGHRMKPFWRRSTRVDISI